MARALAPISSYPGIFYFQTSQPAPPEAALAPLCRQKGGGGEGGNFPNHQHMEQAITLQNLPFVSQSC